MTPEYRSTELYFQVNPLRKGKRVIRGL